MPTLPLLSAPKHPSASHHILAPGGYEGWQFHAVSDDGRMYFSAALHEAWVRDAKYLRKCLLYRRFPTRVNPPDPSEFPAVTFALFEAGHRPVRFTARAQRDEVRVRDDGGGVRVAGSHFDRGEDGAIQLHFRGMDDRRTVTAHFTFRPMLSDVREVALTSDGRHRFVPVHPLCDVEGEISVFEQSGATPRVMSFAGSGSHDSAFGTRVPADAGEKWWTGLALFDGHTFWFTQVGEGDATLIVARKDAEVDTVRVPVEHRAHDVRVGPLHLSRAVVLDGSPFEVVSSFDATAAGEQGRALCSRVRWNRLAHPLWSWLFA